LFRQQGYAATGVKAILATADAPYGSLYHFFPGGKQQLGVAAIERGGAHGRAQIQSDFPPAADVVKAAAAAFAGAADRLEATDFADCTISTIALEVSGSDEPMRTAAAEAFESWLEILEQRFTEAGMRPGRAREVAVELICLMEGGRLLSRTSRSSTPLRIVGRAAVNAVAAGLAEGASSDAE
jgi:AcrR family transcriptional regulator